MPVVTFYGIEEEPVLWRVLHSMTMTTDTTPSGYILDSNPFGLNGDDGQMADHVKNKIASYKAKSRYYTQMMGSFWQNFRVAQVLHAQVKGKYIKMPIFG